PIYRLGRPVHHLGEAPVPVRVQDGLEPFRIQLGYVDLLHRESPRWACPGRGRDGHTSRPARPATAGQAVSRMISVAAVPSPAKRETRIRTSRTAHARSSCGASTAARRAVRSLRPREPAPRPGHGPGTPTARTRPPDT